MASGGRDESFPLLDYHGEENNLSNYKTFFCVDKTNSFFTETREAKNSDEICECVTTGVGNNENPAIGNGTYRREIFSDLITYSWNDINVYSNVKSKKSISACLKMKNKTVEDLSSKNVKQILKNVYGVAYPGEFLAIMGSSGAGKTTLLNALTFQTDFSCTVKGARCLNGCLVFNRNLVRSLSAYVEQDNLFLGTLTVKEHLIFQSLVRMGRNVSYEQKLKRVENVMTELGLDKCQHTIIGYPGRVKGISPGEIKRLSLASEILTNPPLMFCDEPTSGLDSFIALNVINVLKSLAEKGKTVICTIHQPSSEMFCFFDKVFLLAEGRTAFLGKPADAISFFTSLGVSPFANYNPADFYGQLLAVVPNKEQSCKETIKLICDFFDESPYSLAIKSNMEYEAANKVTGNVNCEQINYLALKESLNTGSWISQFRAVFWRSWLNLLREPLLIKVRLFQTVVLSLVIGLIYHQQKLNKDGVMNINGVMFTFLTNVTFQNLFGVITVFCGELPIFLKENANKRYRVDVYFLSKTLAEIPMILAIPIIFTSVVYFWINLNPGFNHFGLTILILILVTNVATSFGYLISCISKNIMMALSVGPPIVIPFLLFGGFLLNSGAIPSYFEWFSYLSWFKYGYEGLLINQWADISNISCSSSDILCPKNGQIVLESYNFHKENFWLDLILLFVLIVVFRLLAFVALAYKTFLFQKHR